VDELGYFRELDPFDYKNNQGMYFIVLNPEDHKNGNQHYQDALFNRVFKDGTCVYDYLNLWWGTYRQYLVKGDTQTFFVREKKGDEHDTTSVWSMFKSFFKRKAQVEVNPHQLRHIFATYINECEKAGEDVKASAAYRMRHSSNMFNTIYNHQSQASKSKSINSFLLTAIDL
jgi:integrase